MMHVVTNEYKNILNENIYETNIKIVIGFY